MLRSRRRRVVAASSVALLLAVVAVALGAPGGPAEDAGIGERSATVPVGPEPDGTEVALDVSVFTPPDDAPGADGDGRRAAVLLAHGFGGSKDDLADWARDLAGDGYVALTYTARGFGASGGLVHLDSPDYEVADASALLDLLADRDDVRLDGDGDPRVGVVGPSYGGALALMLAGYDDRVDATVPVITWHDLDQALFPQQAVNGLARERTTPAPVDPVAAPGVFKQRWASVFYAGAAAGGLAGLTDALAGGAAGSGAGSGAGSDAGSGAGSGADAAITGDPLCGRFAPDVCAAYRTMATTGRAPAQVRELLRASSPAPVLDRVTAPTLLVQGQQDSLFGLDQADATARALDAAGTPVAVRWIDGGHDVGGGGTGGQVVEDSLAWFDHHLRGGADPGAGFEVTLPRAPLEDGPPEEREAPAYGDVTTRTLPLSGEVAPVVSPPGGQPAAITGLPGTGPLFASLAGLGGGAAFALAAPPGQAAVLETEPVPATLTVVGSPRVRLSVTSSTPQATLFASAWVVGADGTATLPRQLVSPVRLTGLRPGRASEVDVALPASAYEVEADQRLRVVVTSTDAAYDVPDRARVYRVGPAEGGSALVVPTVATERLAGTGALVPTPLLLVTGLLLVAALAAGLLARRLRREPAVVADLATVPLAVDGLVKEYSDGFRAVDGVTWRAEAGQVVGLLGPNGAGKTTTMRMLVGLIRPDTGAVHVLGHRVDAGSPVLTRVGALIEGPGFLPHLTGRANLETYWAATGRPAADARLDEALAVADLGGGADRLVRSYSQGMRQRLGIAQAMLGLPEVLLLDEPTNGLDPPQIRAMRDVLARYAAGGRTVVVSSHLLAEVEQTCSHVVVMHRGRVVLTGAVPDLVEESGSTLLGVEGDPGAAARVLADVDGVTEVLVEDDGRVRVAGDAPRPRLVAALVAADVAVTSVDGRRHLEEVFMSLVGGEQAGAAT